MKIESLDTNAEKLLNGTKFVIPRFQRPYSWEKSEIVDFIEDIYTEESNEYFIGSMVMFTDGSRSSVVDGQQRLTTIIIILCAIRNHFLKQGAENLAKGIQGFIERPNKEAKLEFTLSPETSYPYFQDCIMSMEKGNPDTVPTHDEELRIHKAYKIAYKYFEDGIKSVKQDPTIKLEDKPKYILQALNGFRDKLLSVRIVTITLDNEHDAYIVFETLNTRGMDLSVTDLIKNHVTRRWVKENADLDKASHTWNAIINVLAQSSVEIKTDDFFLHQWSSQYGYTTKKSLFSKFTEKIKEESVQKYLQGTEFDAKIYRLIKEPTYHSSDLQIQSQDKDILRSLAALRIFSVIMPNPALISILKGFFSGVMRPVHVKKALKIIENYHFVNSAITSQRSSGSTQKLYSDWAVELVGAYGDNDKISSIITKYGDHLKNDLASFDEFSVHFKDARYSDSFAKDKRLIRYILENVHRSFSQGHPVDYLEMSIEHILPQSKASTELSDSDLVGSLGNLIFVNKALNGALGDNDFSVKKEIFSASGDKGIQNDFVVTYQNWGAKEIQDRCDKLCNLSYKTIWSF